MAGLGLDVALTSDDQDFIKDVVDFIDAPLSPQSLSRLRQRCRSLSPSPSPARQHEAEIEVGADVEAHSLQNNSDFNGLRGTVLARQQNGKLLVEFHCGRGQPYSLSAANLRPAGAAQLALRNAEQEAALARAEAEIGSLEEQLRRGMSVVAEAKGTMDVASRLNAICPERLHRVIADFQPTLSLANIARNWRKIIVIYQAHAERVEASLLQQQQQQQIQQQQGGVDARDLTPLDDEDLAAQIEGVISFIDRPLSPNSLGEIREIRKGFSPA
eukprot:Hpha_TRINITY_DN15481_c6_g10::TRINITY_DN15481_c6_g10_i1::g.174936::m.174936